MDNIWAGIKKDEVDALIKINKDNKPKYNESGYRIPKDSKGCKFSNHWDEYLGERWMGSCPMFECVYDGDKEPLEVCEENDKCPAYEPCDTLICPNHDIEHFEREYCCEKCHPEYKDMY